MFHLLTSTQTPLIRFKSNTEQNRKEELIFSPGGVTRMVYPFLLELVKRGDSPFWVALNPNAPPRMKFEGINLVNVSLPKEVLRGYGSAKEVIWQVFHRIKEGLSKANDLHWSYEYVDYIRYNRKVSQTIDELDRQEDFDVIYIHDFQQIPLGSMITTPKPKLFRWHIPLEQIPPPWFDIMDYYLNKYDAIVVSSKRYSQVLKALNYKGKTYEIYPFIDPAQYSRPSEKEVEEFSNRFGISKEDKLILVVARMDPMKGQDIAIRALKLVKKKVKEAKLMLLGNGSFSKEGIGLSKSEKWANYLMQLTNELELRDSVIFTGYLDNKDLGKAYSRADLVMLPSRIEGFGLVIIEGWLYGKPVLVSKRAGVADLIRDKENGLLIDPEDEEQIAQAIVKVLTEEELATKIAEMGSETARICYAEKGIKAEIEMIEEILKW